MKPKLHPLTRALVEEQKRHGLNGPQMAQLLGVSEGFWSLLKDGKRDPGNQVIKGAFRFPAINVSRLLREASKEKSG